ncbi:MAG: class I SAM-dependent methyltransferase [Candidatus Staskawiczbacteria bacterium]|jgi:predicted O-methyltransferase YrrM
MDVIVDHGNDLEKNGFFVKCAGLLIMPVLDILPADFLRWLMAATSKDSKELSEDTGSAVAIEIMYGRYKRKLFSRGVLQGFYDLFWHHVVSQPKSIRNRLKIIKKNLKEGILKTIKESPKKQINIVAVGGGSARAIAEVVFENFNGLKDRQIHIVNIDANQKAIEISKKLAKELELYKNFEWICGLAQNIESLIKKDSSDIVEMVGLLDYLPDKKAQKMLSKIYPILKTGGLLLAGNSAPNKEEKLVSKIGWPKIYYRSPENFSRLFSASGFSDKNGKIIFEPVKNHMIAVVRK